jgi:hypothetical protein
MSRFGIRTTSTHHVFTSVGDTEITKGGPGLSGAHELAAIVPPFAWYGAGRSSPLSLDLSTGALVQHADLGNFTTSFAAYGDGSLVFGHRVDGQNELVGLGPGGAKWTVTLELTGNDPTGPAIGADSTVYLPWGGVLYAVRD